MNNLLEELEERFNALVKLKNSSEIYSMEDGYAKGVTDYLLFIDETPPLNTIARKIFNDKPSPIFPLYQAVKRAGQEPGKKIWRELMLEIESLRPFIGVFHMQMVGGAKQLGLTSKRVIILHTEKGNNSVCLTGEIPKCYSLKREEPERFEIISMLVEVEAGKSAADIANFLGKNGINGTVQDNIKKEIKKINTLFKENCGVSDELISLTKNGNKNVYFLNKKQYIFQIEK